MLKYEDLQKESQEDSESCKSPLIFKAELLQKSGRYSVPGLWPRVGSLCSGAYLSEKCLMRV